MIHSNWKRIGGRVGNTGSFLGLARKERSELKNLRRVLTNREMFGYFREANIVKPHRLRQVTERHCLAVDIITQLEVNEADVFKTSLAKSWGEWVNT